MDFSQFAVLGDLPFQEDLDFYHI